jgi:hypothetical protein
MAISRKSEYNDAMRTPKVTMTIVGEAASQEKLASMAVRCAATQPEERQALQVTARDVCGDQPWGAGLRPEVAAVVTKATGAMVFTLTRDDVQTAIEANKLGRLVDDAFLKGYAA